MPIEFRCSQCNQLLRVPETSAGKNARCPKCQALMQVPLPAGGAGLGAPPPPPMPGAFAPAAPPSFSEPTPPPVAANSNDPFAFLNTGKGSGGGFANQPAPPPKNPFGDGGASSPFSFPAGENSSTATLNPYSSPSLASGGYSGSLAQYGPRSGLPWENKRQTFSCWWETMGLVIGSPTRAFMQMRQYGGLGAPILYTIWGLGMPVALAFSIFAVIGLVAGIAAAVNDANAAMGVGVILGVFVFYFVLAVIWVLVTATVGMFIAAGIWHVCLMIVGGARQGYETTFRAISFTYGSIMPVGILLAFIPLVGGLIHAVWMIVLLVISLAQAHEIPTGKAVLAVLLPYIAMFVLCFGIFIVMMMVGAMAGN